MCAIGPTSHRPAPQKRTVPGNRALRRGRVSFPNHVYLVTTATRKREPVFREFMAGCAAARCFDDPRTLGHAQMLAWVLMPDHVHWLIRLGGSQELGAVVNRLKSRSARVANKALRRGGPLWAPAFHDHALRADEDLRRSARYLIANPVRAGLVERIGDYAFWNAIWL
ncbi:MAG TPA: transposase [Rhodanobacteraceae bacterium]|nr:transposase [Rhodanobacteraceae bacterium]